MMGQVSEKIVRKKKKGTKATFLLETRLLKTDVFIFDCSLPKNYKTKEIH